MEERDSAPESPANSLLIGKRLLSIQFADDDFSAVQRTDKDDDHDKEVEYAICEGLTPE